MMRDERVFQLEIRTTQKNGQTYKVRVFILNKHKHHHQLTSIIRTIGIDLNLYLNHTAGQFK